MCSIFNLVIKVIFVICLVSGHEEEDICYYKTQEPSQCILLDYCEELKALIQKSRERVMNLHCGWVQKHPKVCCPTKPSIPTKTTSTATIIETRTTTLRTITPRTTTPRYPEPPDLQPNSCATTKIKHGTCVPLSSCSLFVNMIMKDDNAIEYIEESRCDDESKINVCCEMSSQITLEPEGQFKYRSKEKLCKVPNGDAGVCIQLQKCPPLMDLYKKKHKTPQENLYFQQSYCGPPRSNKIKVCCPPESQWSKLEPKPVLYPTLAQTPAPTTNKPVTKVTQGVPIAPATGNIGDDLNRNLIIDEDLNKNCGIDTSSGNKIVGGSDVAIDQYPWMALLEYAGNALLCGGSVISSQFVLTAAHCINTIQGKPLFVRLSEYNITSSPTDYVEVDGGGIDEITVEIVPVLTTYIHPNFGRTTRLNDVGLIRLSKHVNINSDFIKAICLPTTNILPELINRPTNFTVAGWGSTATEIESEVKQEALVPWVQCDEDIQTDFQICAGGVEGIDSCQGDSGGPLMHLHNDRYYAVGIISYGHRICGKKGYAATHTYVYKYLSWIKDVMNGKIKN